VAKPHKNPELLTIFLIVFVDVLGFTVILPLLPFFSESLGASPFVVGMVVSSYGFCQLISGPILGQLSDRIGRRPVLLVSQFGTLLGFIILGLAHQLWMVFLARIIDGITAGNITVAQAYISDVTTPQERTRAMGMIGAAFGLGFILGPAVSGMLAGFGHSAPIWASCTLSALSICGSFFFLKDVRKPDKGSAPAPRSRRQRYRELLMSQSVKAHYFSYFAFAFSFATFVSGLALFCERRLHWKGLPFSAVQVGYVLAYSGLINLSVQTVFLGRLVKRFGEHVLVRTGFALSAVGLLVIGLSQNVPEFLIGLSLNSFGSALLRPSLTGLISRNVSPQHQGFALGFAQTLLSVAQIICPLISGLLIERELYLGFTGIAATSCMVGLLATIINGADRKAQELVP
jgi:multidrug resistance protein